MATPAQVRILFLSPSILACPLYAATQDTRAVGVASGVMGLSKLLSSLLLGALVDLLPRSSVVNAAASVGPYLATTGS